MEKSHESMLPGQGCVAISIIDPKEQIVAMTVGTMTPSTLGDKVLSLLSMSLMFWNERSQEPGFLENHMEVKEWQDTHDGLSITVQLKD